MIVFVVTLSALFAMLNNNHILSRPASEHNRKDAGRFFNLMSMKKTGHEHEQKWSCIMNESNHVS